MFTACIFDLDGTLANTLNSIAAIGNQSLSALDLPPIDTAQYRYMVGNGADTLMRRMLAHTKPDYTQAHVQQLREIYDKQYSRDPMQLVTPYPGMVDFINKLKTKGIPAAVLSNKPDDMTKATVYPLFGETAFALVQGQRPEFPLKPDPTALLHICNTLGVRKADVLYIGDTGTDMDTGKNAGLTTAGVLWGFRQETELAAHNATHLIHTPAELEALIFG